MTRHFIRSKPLRMRTALGGVLLLAAGAIPARAQEIVEGPLPDECYGFAFGAWTPALDWHGAGHRALLPADPDPRSRSGAIWQQSKQGPVLLLFPPWWPAGVSVTLDRDAARGDTVSGTARAFVADGRMRAPVAPVRAWRIVCAP